VGVFAVIAVTGAAMAEPTASKTALDASPQYPFAVRLTLSADTLRAQFAHEGSGWMSAPPNPASTTPVGEQARDTYALALGRMFQVESPEIASLDLSVSNAALEWDADGWHAVVEHALVLRTAQNEELARWRVKGREKIAGLGERAIPVAFARAAEHAAERFEATFSEPSAVAHWLREQGVEPGPIARAGSPVDPPAPSPFGKSEGAPRGRFVAYLDAGLGIFPFVGSSNTVFAGGGTRYSGDDVGYAFSARLGFAGRWGLVQLGLARWSSQITGQQFRGDFAGSMVGVDAGPLIRLASDFELALGVGAHWVSEEMAVQYPVGSPETSSLRVLPSAVGILRLARAVTSGGGRLRVSLEVRQRFDSTTRLAYFSSANGSSWQELESGTSLTLLLGYELPMGGR
jgi:hypothetical protein